ncbi:hypothetical protein PCASD_26732, partial [Puccinia coronata f. sp. avenae]
MRPLRLLHTSLSDQFIETGTCASPSNSEPADLLAGLLAELAQVPALQAGLPARRAGTSSASRSACSPSWYLYQPGKQVNLLAESAS